MLAKTRDDQRRGVQAHRWYASFESMGRQLDRIMGQPEWISVRPPGAGDGPRRKVLKRKRAMR